MNLYPLYPAVFISPITGRLASFEQLPELEIGQIWIGTRSKRALPSLKIIDLRIDVNFLLDKVAEIIPFPFDISFVITSPDPRVPNAQSLSTLGTGITKLTTGGIIAIAESNVEYITLAYLNSQLSNYVTISSFSGRFATEFAATFPGAFSSAFALSFPGAFLSAYSIAITASLTAYTATVLTPAIAALNVNLTGAITASGALNSTITTSFASNPIFPGNGSLTMPKGTTAQRPSSATVGMQRYNTNLGAYEVYNGSSWVSLNTSGGTVSSVGISGSTGLSVSGSPITTSGTINLTLGNELQSLSALSSNGILVRTGAATYSSRTITASTGISITNPDGASGNPTISLSNIGTAGTYGYPASVTTNAQGQISSITAGSTPLTAIYGSNLQTQITIVSPNISAVGLTDNVYLLGTQFLRIPTGTTAQRPDGSLTATVAGMMRFNTTLGVSEQYNGSSWLQDTFGTVTSITAGAGLAGGTITGIGTISIANDTTLPGTGAVIIPRGTVAQRPSSPAIGMIRYNIDSSVYESYSGSSWLSQTFGTVTSVSGTSGQISSTGGNTPVLALISTGVGAGSYTNASITVDTYGRATAVSSGTPPILGVAGQTNQIYVTPATQYPVIYIASNPIIPGNASITIPIGTTAQRSGAPTLGMFRANSDTNVLEYYNSTSWLTINSSNATVSSISITGSTGLSISGSPITSSGTIGLTLGTELQGLSSLATTGIVARTGTGAYANRTITASTGISVTNGNGVSGNPTVSVSNIPISALSGYPSNTTTFLRGDGTWSNTFTGGINITGGRLEVTSTSGSIPYASWFAYFKLSGTSAVSGGYNLGGLPLSIACSGSIWAIEFESTSSIKKKNILSKYQDFKEELKVKFDTIDFVKYEWKDKPKKGLGEYYGYIAENVAENFPELVNLESMDYSPSILKFAKVNNISLQSCDIIFNEDVNIAILSKIKYYTNNEKQYETIVLEQLNSSTYRISIEKDIIITDEIFVYGIYEKVPLVSKTRFSDMVAARLKILIDEVSILSQRIDIMDNKYISNNT